MEEQGFDPENVLKRMLKRRITTYELCREVYALYGNHMDRAFREINDKLSEWLKKGYVSFSEGRYRINI